MIHISGSAEDDRKSASC